MSVIIHVELDLLCFLVLAVIARQVRNSVSQQMNRLLFRTLVYGIMLTLALDIVWIIIEGKIFPGAVLINKAVNVLYLSLGVVLGGIWYLYVLEMLGHKITKGLTLAVMAPGAAFTALNTVSACTGWVFTVSPENVYAHGSLFWLQTAGALTMLFIPLLHIVFRLLSRKGNTPRPVAAKLLKFYFLPVVFTLVPLSYTGLPGTWTSAAVSIVLMYIEDQDREIIRDSLTGLNNRKTLDNVFADYVKLDGEGRRLYLFMMDLDNFKMINDTLGHSAGDRALVQAAGQLTRSVAGMKAYISRFGGDEFVVMSFFSDDGDALAYKERLTESFREYNNQEDLPYVLSPSIGFSRYEAGMSVTELCEAADGELYREKKKKNLGRIKKPGLH